MDSSIGGNLSWARLEILHIKRNSIIDEKAETSRCGLPVYVEMDSSGEMELIWWLNLIPSAARLGFKYKLVFFLSNDTDCFRTNRTNRYMKLYQDEINTNDSTRLNINRFEFF